MGSLSKLWRRGTESFYSQSISRRAVTFVLDRNGRKDIIQCMSNYSISIESVKQPPTDLNRLENWLRVLADPSRLLILDLIIQGVQCNCELGGALKMAPNLISHHLKALRAAGLVHVERDTVDARWVYYSVNKEALELLNAALGAFFNPARIRPRRLTCGPDGKFVRLAEQER